MRAPFAALALATAVLTGACTTGLPAGTGGLAERAALPPGPQTGDEGAVAAGTMARLSCLDAQYERLAALGLADRRPARAALARAARRDALRWTAAGLVRDGALAAETYAREVAALSAGTAAPAGGHAC